MSHIAGNARFTPSCLPLPAQLNLHLDSDDFTRKLMFEQLAGDKVDLYGQNSYEAEMRRKGFEDPLPWEELAEEQREECRSRFRSMGESMRTEDFPVTIRPVTVGGVVKRITELYGPLLEKLCEFEQNRRVRGMRQHGWTLGPDHADFLTSSALRPFSELSPDQKDEVRLAVRDYPKLLNTVGLELVRRD